MNYNPTIWNALTAFDGKHVDSLRSLLAEIAWAQSDFDYLLYLIENEDENIQVGASWLLLNTKHSTSEWNDEFIARIIALLNENHIHWQITLHILQMIEQFPINSIQLSDLFPIIKRLVKHKKTFVRAWAFNALIWIADKDSSFRSEVQSVIRNAQEHEAASVKARIRNCLPNNKWLKHR